MCCSRILGLRCRSGKERPKALKDGKADMRWMRWRRTKSVEEKIESNQGKSEALPSDPEHSSCPRIAGFQHDNQQNWATRGHHTWHCLWRAGAILEAQTWANWSCRSRERCRMALVQRVLLLLAPVRSATCDGQSEKGTPRRSRKSPQPSTNTVPQSCFDRWLLCARGVHGLLSMLCRMTSSRKKCQASRSRRWTLGPQWKQCRQCHQLHPWAQHPPKLLRLWAHQQRRCQRWKKKSKRNC